MIEFVLSEKIQLCTNYIRGRKVKKMIDEEERLDPNQLLEQIQREEIKKVRGQLKIFFGYAAGVGKTYAMLDAARELKQAGVEVVVGYVEPHARPETLALLDGFEQLEAKEITYRNIKQRELDLDGAIKRRPELILVDELAHTNAKGSRHYKRWQDIEELLQEGIDVFTTVNVQHIESLNDVVSSITNVIVKETIPDKVLDEADQVELIDIAPEDLQKRFSKGKIYEVSQAKLAKYNFFKIDNLHALREIALRRIADRVNKEVQISRRAKKDAPILPTAEQFLVCISASKSSARVIRTASRMANAFNARWIAVYIETPRDQKSSKEIATQLNKNMDLAEKLGGEVTLIHGEDVVEELIRYAKIRNITKIIIGKNQPIRRYNLKLLGKGDIVDRLLASTKFIDVHVIPGRPEDYTMRKRQKVWGDFSLKGYHAEIFKSIMVLLIATIIGLGLRQIGFADQNMMMVYTIAVLIISIEVKGYTIGLAAAVLATLCYNYLFIEPHYTFLVDEYSYLITTMIVALTTSMLTTRLQEQARLYSKREEHTQMLYRIGRSFLYLSGEENIIVHGLEQLSTVLRKNIIYYKVVNGECEDKPYIGEYNKESTAEIGGRQESAVVDWVLRNHREAGRGTDTLPGSHRHYIPIKGQGNIMAIVGISYEEEDNDREQQSFIQTIITQMALALERERLTKEQEVVKIEIERERLRSNLLRAISHDLRTPLTGISGASSLILNSGEQLDEETKQELIKGIYEDSEWLVRLVENLLSMTKIDEGKLHVKKDIEVVEEVIAEAISHVKKRVENHTLEVKVPNQMLMIPMDGKLIEQVIINLVENAFKYTKEDSTIKVEVVDSLEEIICKVSDNGEGIPEESIEFIFDRFYTVAHGSTDSRRCVGLGLAICKSIIQAHGGKIFVRNNPEGGAEFIFTLPKENEIG